MQKREILSILDDWNFWNQTLETGIKRPFYLEKMREYVPSGQVLVITGPRRSGKSYLMRQFIRDLMEEKEIPKNNVLMVNFEDPRLISPDAKLLQEIFEIHLETMNPQGKPYLFLDEIQEVEGWEKWVRTMHELDKAHLIISGSNSKLLSTELASALTGRHLDITVFPLSFKEFLSFRDLEIKTELDQVTHKVELNRALSDYLEYGGFPEVVLGDQKKEIMLHYFRDILDRDLIKRYRIRKRKALKNLAKFCFTNISARVTHNSLKKQLSITAMTVDKFAGYLEAAYLVFLLKRFSFKVKEQDRSPRKVYAIDTGLANTIGFRFSENMGRLVENLVYLELKRRQFQQPGFEFYYWKNRYNREVDFLVKKDQEISQLMQVSWNLSRPKTKEREITSLMAGLKEFDMKEGLIISEKEEGEEKKEGKLIKFLPLWKWLLRID